MTIKLDKNVIERAKVFACNHKISLSKLIESYLNSITKVRKDNIEITPLVESINGVIELPESYDYKNDYANYLMEKYK